MESKSHAVEAASSEAIKIMEMISAGYYAFTDANNEIICVASKDLSEDKLNAIKKIIGE